MELLPKELQSRLPPLYSTEVQPDPLIQLKFLTPDSNWTLYAIEFDGEDLFFGLVIGFEAELGYFRLSELQEVRGPLGLTIERESVFSPIPLSHVQRVEQV